MDGLKFLKRTLSPVVRFAYWPKFVGKENLQEGGKIIASNHSSYLDPVGIIMMSRPHVRFFAKENKNLQRLYDFAGQITISGTQKEREQIDGDTRRMLVEGTKKVKGVLEKGENFGIFPEGTMSPTGEILEFQEGAAKYAIKYKGDVVPVYVGGVHVQGKKKGKLYAKNFPWWLTRKMTVMAGEPIPYNAAKKEGKNLADERRDLTKIIRDSILDLEADYKENYARLRKY